MRLAWLIALAGLCACGPSIQEQGNIAAYQADQLLCVTNATNRAQADYCREQVKALWCGPGGPLNTAGACVHAGYGDGGIP